MLRTPGTPEPSGDRLTPGPSAQGRTTGGGQTGTDPDDRGIRQRVGTWTAPWTRGPMVDLTPSWQAYTGRGDLKVSVRTRSASQQAPARGTPLVSWTSVAPARRSTRLGASDGIGAGRQRLVGRHAPARPAKAWQVRVRLTDPVGGDSISNLYRMDVVTRSALPVPAPPSTPGVAAGRKPLPAPLLLDRRRGGRSELGHRRGLRDGARGDRHVGLRQRRPRVLRRPPVDRSPYGILRPVRLPHRLHEQRRPRVELGHPVHRPAPISSGSWSNATTRSSRCRAARARSSSRVSRPTATSSFATRPPPRRQRSTAGHRPRLVRVRLARVRGSRRDRDATHHPVISGVPGTDGTSPGYRLRVVRRLALAPVLALVASLLAAVAPAHAADASRRRTRHLQHRDRLLVHRRRLALGRAAGPAGEGRLARAQEAAHRQARRPQLPGRHLDLAVVGARLRASPS